MGIVFRQSIKTSLVVFTGAFLGIIIMFLSTRFIDKQALGFTRDLTYKALVFSQFCILGLNSTMSVFIHKYQDVRKKLLLTFCILTPLLFAIMAVVPFYLLEPWVLHHFQPADIPFIQRYYMLIPAYMTLFILLVLLEQYLGTQMRVAVSSFMKEVVLRVVNIAIILLFAFGYVSLNFLIISTVLIYLIPIIIYIIIALRIDSFGFSFKFGAFSKSEYKELLHFSWYHFLLSLSITLMGYLDAIAIPLYDHSGFKSTAIYTTAVFFVSFMQMPSKAMMTPTITVLAQAVANADTAKAKDIFARSSINVLLATTFMAVMIICNIGNALVFMNNGYTQVGLIFLILFIGRYVDLATGLNDAILSITNYYKFSFYVSIIMIGILFALIRQLVPIYGVYGAAWSTSITLILFNICKYFFVWKKLDMQPFSMNTILVLIAGAVTLAAGYYFPNFLKGQGHMYIYTIADAAMRGGIIVAVYLAMLYWLKPSADLREYIASVKKNKRLF
ncbi:hypothetical protein CJD36_010580 [Flavipsychrobacter stenotrophus]|uniref:Uncharacterized protein n=1 Tax=Flavipsychrobacter stenotrophus TaxID=2077091 RepID=A0A2S7SUY4_9BACT|nr:oligosaccharide flippase family protein [Flavipsychrobacter stenotrophus]PQJ10415.1 hypothetical protein CJD36_010580 [Flavipsychrobacter stenotrophus]